MNGIHSFGHSRELLPYYVGMLSLFDVRTDLTACDVGIRCSDHWIGAAHGGGRAHEPHV